MGKLVTVVGPSGVGKTSLVRALSGGGKFATAYEGHEERPFQSLFEKDRRYGLANQLDYLLLRAEQERGLRGSPRIGLIDGGLDLDYRGFARLFHARGWLNDAELDLCRRFYELARSLLAPPDFVIRLNASAEVIRARLASRQRINIASAADTELFNRFLDDWLAPLPADRWFAIDVSTEGLAYEHSRAQIAEKLAGLE